MATTTNTTYNIGGHSYSVDQLPAALNRQGQSVWLGGGGGASPYMGADLAALDAQQNLYDAEYGIMPLDLAELSSQRDLEQGRRDIIPLNLASIAANRKTIEEQLGLIPGQLTEVELQKAYAQAQYEAGNLQLPVIEDQRSQALLGSRHALESANAQRDLSLSANQGERLGLQDEARRTNRDLSLVPPDVARSYAGNNYINPAFSYARDDANAKLGILGQRGSTVDLSDSNARLNASHAAESSALANKAADDQFAAQKAMFDTRDEQLAAQMQGFENSKGRINLGYSEGAAALAGLTAREAAEKLGYKESDARLAGLSAREARIQLGEQQHALQLANINAQRQRITNPQGGGGGGYGGSYGGGGGGFNGTYGGAPQSYSTPTYSTANQFSNPAIWGSTPSWGNSSAYDAQGQWNPGGVVFSTQSAFAPGGQFYNSGWF